MLVQLESWKVLKVCCCFFLASMLVGSFVRSFGGYEKCPSHLNINFRLKRYMVGISRISERVCDTLAQKKTLPTKTSTINTFWISSKLYAKFCFSLGTFLDFWFLLLFYQFFAIAKVLVFCVRFCDHLLFETHWCRAVVGLIFLIYSQLSSTPFYLNY